MRASTAAHNSARFAYVSPAGDLGDSKGSMIDGGYFENYGALTALELAAAAGAALNPPKHKPKVKLVFLLISSDPDLDDPRAGTAPIRIDEPAGSSECLVSITEREAQPPTTPGSPNYLRIQRNRLKTPGSMSSSRRFTASRTRAQRRGRAAAQLAVTVCLAFSHLAKGKPGESAEDAVSRWRTLLRWKSRPRRSRRRERATLPHPACGERGRGQSVFRSCRHVPPRR